MRVEEGREHIWPGTIGHVWRYDDDVLSHYISRFVLSSRAYFLFACMTSIFDEILCDIFTNRNIIYNSLRYPDSFTFFHIVYQVACEIGLSRRCFGEFQKVRQLKIDP
jgi:hypothetical protein